MKFFISYQKPITGPRTEWVSITLLFSFNKKSSLLAFWGISSLLWDDISLHFKQTHRHNHWPYQEHFVVIVVIHGYRPPACHDEFNFEIQACRWEEVWPRHTSVWLLVHNVLFFLEIWLHFINEYACPWLRRVSDTPKIEGQSFCMFFRSKPVFKQ